MSDKDPGLHHEPWPGSFPAKKTFDGFQSRFCINLCLCQSEVEDEPRAPMRFEHAIDVVIKSGPKHRQAPPAKSKAAQAIRKIIPATMIKMDESSEGLRASLKSVGMNVGGGLITYHFTLPSAQGV
jgi:hypothetical protein